MIIAGGTIGIAGGLMVLLLQGAYANSLSWQHASLITGPTTVRSSVPKQHWSAVKKLSEAYGQDQK